MPNRKFSVHTGYTMRTISALVTCALLFFIAAPGVYAANSCDQINCDCNSLPTASWKTSCLAQEKKLLSTCLASNHSQPTGYCSLHGPAATNIPLGIDITPGEAVEKKQIVKLNHKLASLFWALHKDLDKFQQKISDKQFTKSAEVLSLIENNVATLFSYQKNISASHLALDAKGESEKSWRHFAEDTAKIGTVLLDYSKAMLQVMDSLESKKQKLKMRKQTMQVLEVCGKIHEQSGYGFGLGMRHKKASVAWKAAAEVANKLVENTFEHSVDQQDHRLQAAMRLHKATYYWVVAAGPNKHDPVINDNKTVADNAQALKELVEKEMTGTVSAKHE